VLRVYSSIIHFYNLLTINNKLFRKLYEYIKTKPNMEERV